MKKIVTILSLFLVLFAFDTASAQVQMDSISTVENPVEPAKKLNFGLGFGLNFVGGTSVSLSPNLTYQVSDKISAGAGLLFNYTAIKDLQNTTTIGANIIGNYYPIDKLLTTLEFAEMHVNRNVLYTNIKDNFWDSALFVGVGYQITPKISVGGKYNLLYDKDKSVYSSPLVPFVNISF